MGGGHQDGRGWRQRDGGGGGDWEPSGNLSRAPLAPGALLSTASRASATAVAEHPQHRIAAHQSAPGKHRHRAEHITRRVRDDVELRSSRKMVKIKIKIKIKIKPEVKNKYAVEDQRRDVAVGLQTIG